MEIAKELNYVPNHSARQLVNKQSNTIGLIVPDLENMFFSSFVKKFQEIFLKEDYFVLVANSNDNYKNDLKLINMLISKGVDALVIAPSIDASMNEDEYLKHLDGVFLPYIVIDRVFDNLKGNSVMFDNELGMYMATKSVINHNHKNIAFINGDTIRTGGKTRFEGFKRAMDEAGLALPKQGVFKGSYTFESGYNLAKEIIEDPNNYTAVVASNDLNAYGFMKKANELGLRIPEDISIVGYDNLIFSSMLNVPLTSVHQNIDEFVKETTKLLGKVMKNDKSSGKVVLKPKLVERKSVKNLQE